MLGVHAHVRVGPEDLEAFLEESRQNLSRVARTGRRRHVVLDEVHVDQFAADAHEQTAHWGRWRDAVAGMMAQPRTSTRFTAGLPGDDGW